ncbi:MAG: AtuA-related protein [Longimicrobiales bacterium]
MARVLLYDLAHGRSGDKGDTVNVGVIARRSEYWDVIRATLTKERVAEHFAGMFDGRIERFELPNLQALNFLLHGALDGGGTVSLMTDAQGKTFSTAMLRMMIDVPDALARALPDRRTS